jgi:hypothetical protein
MTYGQTRTPSTPIRPAVPGSPAAARPRTATRARRRWRTAGLLGVVLTAVLAGCGVPADPRPLPVTPPPQYRTLTPAPPPTPEGGGVEEVLCLARDQHLTRVTRTVDRPLSPEELLADLVAGANESERAQGLQSVVAGLTSLSLESIRNRVATVAIGESLEELAFDNQLLVYAQIVCTLDSHPAIDGVFFSRDGEQVSVPRGDGTQTRGMLTATDYSQLMENYNQLTEEEPR